MRFTDYVLAPVESKDGKLSIRRLMAIAALAGLVKYVETHANPAPDVMYAFITLIAILLGLSTAQNIGETAISAKATQNPAA